MTKDLQESQRSDQGHVNDQVLVFRDHFPGANNGSTPIRN